MGVVRNFFDGLSNALTGAGTRGDPRQANRYSFIPLTQVDIENAYRGSGLMRKIIDIPAEDTVREWREWKGDAKDLSAIWAEEKRLGIPQKIKRAEILRGLGGGALILGLPGNPAMPANVKAMGQGGLEYIHVVSRFHLTAEGQWVDNPLDPLFGGPRMWMLNTGSGQVRVHPSRVICFKADEVPGLVNGSAEDVFWGESRVQRVLSAVQDCDTARSSFAALIHKAQRTRVGIPNLSEQIASGGEADVQKRIATFALGESMFNATIYDAGSGKDSNNPGEQIDDVQYTFTGMKEVMEAFGRWASALSDIPSTRLLGTAAEGLNANGESQQKDWNKQIRARQTLVTGPCLDQLDRFLIPSALGKSDAKIWYEFPPLDLPDEKTVAETFKITMEAAEKLQMTGAVPDIAFNKGLQSTITEAGWMPALEGALAEIPEDERFGGEPEAEEANKNDDLEPDVANDEAQGQ
jgi:phage-related protein (TIGR01555 family)